MPLKITDLVKDDVSLVYAHATFAAIEQTAHRLNNDKEFACNFRKKYGTAAEEAVKDMERNFNA